MPTDPVPATVAEDLTDAVDLFGDVAAGELLAPLLLVIGFVLIVFASAAFGFLTLGAVVDFLTLD